MNPTANGPSGVVANIRRTLHFWVADLLYYSGFFSLCRLLGPTWLARKKTCVLGFHRVLTEEELARTDSMESIVLKETTFAALLKYLSHHFRIVSFDEFTWQGGSATDGTRPTCLLTFDDGWGDNFSRAFPWLRKYLMPAVIFLVTGMIDTSRIFWIERLTGIWKRAARRQEIQKLLGNIMGRAGPATDLAEVIEYLKKMPDNKRQEALAPILSEDLEPGDDGRVDRMLTWDQARIMGKSGIDFGAHTATHPLLVYEDDTRVKEELQDGKQTIEEKLGTPVHAFAYPNGSWDDRVRRWVDSTGYRCAFTTQRGWHHHSGDSLAIPRILLHEGVVTGRDGRFSPAMLNLRLFGWF